MKKLSMVFLCLSLMIVSFVAVGCGDVSEVKSISVIGNAYLEFVAGETTNKGNIKIKATFSDNTEVEVNGNNERVSMTNIDTSIPGERNITITYTDEKGKTAQTTIAYMVYSQAQTIKTQNDVRKITANSESQDSGVIFFANTGEYTLENFPISRSLKLIGRNGCDVVLSDIKIAQSTASKDIVVSFQNLVLSNQNTQKILVCDSKITRKLDLTIQNSTIRANGYVSNGLTLPCKGDILISNCIFETPDEDGDIFDRMICYASSGRVLTDSCVIKNCTISCSFSYGLYQMTNYTFEGNRVEATLRSVGLGQSYLSNSSQTYFVEKKNPTLIHFSFGTRVPNTENSEKYTIIVKNNIIKDLQNLIRAYEFDTIAYSKGIDEYDKYFDLQFSGNQMSGVAVLLNTSSRSYKAVSKILADIKADTGLVAGTSYYNERKAVIQQDTEIAINGDIYYEYVSNTKSYIYYDFSGKINTVATMTINEEEYEYIGYSNSMNNDDTSMGHVIKNGNSYYIIKSLNYSPKGDVLNFISASGSTTTSIDEAKVYTKQDIKLSLGIESLINEG